MKVYLVETYEQTNQYSKEEKLQQFQHEKDALARVGQLISGQTDSWDEEVELRKVFVLDTTYNTLTELNPQLDGFKLTLVEKPEVLPG